MRRLAILNKTARILSIFRNQDGNAAIEYGMIAALVAVITAVGLTSVSTGLSTVFATIVDLM